MKKTKIKKDLSNKIKKIGSGSKIRGITLISLVITIVILLIISTAAITFIVTSDIFTKAKFSTDSYNNSTEKENLELAKFNNEIENLQSTREDVQGASNPVGTVISCIRDSAPEGYLVCDGTEYDISQYPALAEELHKVYSGYNTTTEGKFKVPDLRGEFLRGSGTNGHTSQGNGDNIGVHQNATEHLFISNFGNGSMVTCKDAYSTNEYDTIVASSARRYGSFTSGTSDGVGSYSNYTSRPTNTSVLYCIKY